MILRCNSLNKLLTLVGEKCPKITPNLVKNLPISDFRTVKRPQKPPQLHIKLQSLRGSSGWESQITSPLWLLSCGLWVLLLRFYSFGASRARFRIKSHTARTHTCKQTHAFMCCELPQPSHTASHYSEGLWSQQKWIFLSSTFVLFSRNNI